MTRELRHRRCSSGPVLHRRRMGRAVVGRDDRRDRLRHRGAVFHDRRGRGRRHLTARSRRPVTRSTRARGRGSPTPSGPSTSRARAGSRTWRRHSAQCGRANRACSARVAQYSRRYRRGAPSRTTPALADTFPFEESPPTGGGKFGLLVREPVGVVGAIIPWNAPLALICHKIGAGAPRRLHGGAQVVAGGAGCGLRVGRGRRGDRAAAGRPQRRDRRS